MNLGDIHEGHQYPNSQDMEVFTGTLCHEGMNTVADNRKQ